jgi:hypothetical protein
MAKDVPHLLSSREEYMDVAQDRIPTPTMQELKAARAAFEEMEPRSLFYRAATELAGLALRGESNLSLTEAIAVLLQTWNKDYYRFHRFDSQHFSDLEHSVDGHQQELADFRNRSIENFSEGDEAVVKRLFADFEVVLGPVGAAKCLHLLAPRFFPLWDRTIAKAYGLSLKNRGQNAELYLSFMRIAKLQREALPDESAIGQLPLKALDEYNYCKYTKHCTMKS